MGVLLDVAVTRAMPVCLSLSLCVPAVTGLVDVLPTVLEAAGAALPTDRVLDGRSLLPLVLGSAASSNSNGKQQQASGHQQQASGQGESAGAAEPSSPQREAREPLHATWFHYHNAALAAVRVGPHKAHFETREVENNLIKVSFRVLLRLAFSWVAFCGVDCSSGSVCPLIQCCVPDSDGVPAAIAEGALAAAAVQRGRGPL